MIDTLDVIHVARVYCAPIQTFNSISDNGDVLDFLDFACRTVSNNQTIAIILTVSDTLTSALQNFCT